MKNVTHIVLNFENLESVTFHINDIKDIETGKIQSRISRIAINSVAQMETMASLELTILASADIETDAPFCSESAFERILSTNDITSVTFHFNNGTSENIYVPYEETFEAENIYQTSFLDENGDLNIIIKKGE